ncbi:unnamed protein product [Linum tenue]|uniref:AMP-activated protein kinase glycogen-binding domain-containing protein n=1 Tax=Linum tenue TaxID=586396 RepID=A0AAV0QPX8_9ROSI|nr:unnamed protein product [Linum tenue]
MEACIAGCCMGKQVSSLSWKSRNPFVESAHRFPGNIGWGTKMKHPAGPKHLYVGSIAKHRKGLVSWRIFTVPVSLEKSLSLHAEASADSQDQLHDKPLTSDQVFQTFLRLQMMVNEEALDSFKAELAVMEQETQALVALAEEIAQAGIPAGSRKINGKYIQSHLVSRLQGLHGKLKEQVKDVVAAQLKEVSLFWCGMAESVQVMGSFDGWSQGEHLSPEYDGYLTKFTTTLMLRPGRYEIKFLVDGEWKLSPEYPAVGEGLTENNLLVVA